MYIALLMIVPLIIGIIGLILSASGKKNGNLSFMEFLAMEAAVLVIFAGGYGISRWQAVADTEIVSGVVTNKFQDTVSCSHSYSCNCTTTTDSKGNRSETCQTCYDHSHDYNWVVETNAMGMSFDIDRVDRQGADTPPRWAQVRIGEPVAMEHSYKNYIKADPFSVLVRRGTKPPNGLPLMNYPNNTYDYSKVNRFLQVGTNDPNARVFNERLMSMNGLLGPRKQVNVIMMEVNSSDPSYEYVIQEQWLNGKKNDAIIIFGVTQYPKIDWVRVVSWTKSEELKVELRDSLQEIGRIDNVDAIMTTIQSEITNKFVRRSFKDFEYLMASVTPSTGVTVFLFILGLAVCIGLYIYFWNNDPFGTEGSYIRSGGLNIRYSRIGGRTR